MAQMNITSIKCKIEIFCAINPSEDLTVLEKIRETIHSMQYQRIYKRTLEKNLLRNTTWFYLNKQAAFAEKIAICEESDESPLGPLKVVLTSFNIDRIIEWLIFE